VSHGLGRGPHAEVEELRERVRMLEADCELHATLARETAKSRDNCLAAHAVEEKLRREAEIRWKRAAEEWMHTCDKRDQLAGHVRRLREALKQAQWPPPLIAKFHDLLSEVADV
jgi:hypothetical protein